MYTRKEFYTQAFIVTILGAFSVSLIIIIFDFFCIEVSEMWGTSYAPWLEEGVKYLLILRLMFLINFNVKAIPFIGVGFAIVEAIRHIELTGYASPRAFLAHLIFGLVMALFIYLTVRSKNINLRGALFALALLAPVTLHLIYNIYLG